MAVVIRVVTKQRFCNIVKTESMHNWSALVKCTATVHQKSTLRLFVFCGLTKLLICPAESGKSIVYQPNHQKGQIISSKLVKCSTLLSSKIVHMHSGAFSKGFLGLGPSQQQESIAYKELFPVVIAAHIWGHLWCHRHVLFHLDNNTLVHTLTFRLLKYPA